MTFVIFERAELDTRLPHDNCACRCLQRKSVQWRRELLLSYLAGRNRIINFCRQTNRKRHG